MYDEIVAHAVGDAPNECCGIVSTDQDVAVRVYRTTNVRPQPKFGFEIDGHELLEIYNETEDAGLERALYHSHPRSEPKPSQTDINLADRWPGVVWIIVGHASTEPEVRAWKIDGPDVTEVELVVD